MLASTVQFSRYGRNHGLLGLHPATAQARPFESAPIESGCFLRTQQRAHSARRSVRLVPQPRRSGSVLAAQSQRQLN